MTTPQTSRIELEEIDENHPSYRYLKPLFVCEEAEETKFSERKYRRYTSVPISITPRNRQRLLKYVNDRFASSRMSDKSFAAWAQYRLLFLVSAHHVKKAREELGIPSLRGATPKASTYLKKVEENYPVQGQLFEFVVSGWPFQKDALSHANIEKH